MSVKIKPTDHVVYQPQHAPKVEAEISDKAPPIGKQSIDDYCSLAYYKNLSRLGGRIEGNQRAKSLYELVVGSYKAILSVLSERDAASDYSGQSKITHQGFLRSYEEMAKHLPEESLVKITQKATRLVSDKPEAYNTLLNMMPRIAGLYDPMCNNAHRKDRQKVKSIYKEMVNIVLDRLGRAEEQTEALEKLIGEESQTFIEKELKTLNAAGMKHTGQRK